MDIDTNKPIKLNNTGGAPEKGLTKKQIEYAIASTPSMKQAAQYLNVAYQTFKKYAERYDLFKPLPSNKGIKRRSFVGQFGKHDIASILAGENPNPFRETTLLTKAIREGLLPPSCSNCGCDYHNWTQKKPQPLVLDFLDLNPQNTKIENLRVLCFNCVYELHTSHKGWYRHRETPISQAVEQNILEQTNTTAQVTHEPHAKAMREHEVLDELEYIPFEEFQKSLEN